MTSTNEAGHGLPELPDQDVDTERGDYYSMDAMEAYGRACYDLALSRGVPADMVLVPREPTPEMLRAGFLSESEGFDIETPADAPGLVYRAMLAAAPAAAGAQGEGAKSARESFNAGWMDGHDKGWSSGYQRALYDAAGMPFDFDWNGAKARAYAAYNHTSMPQKSVTAPQPAADGGVRERAREIVAFINGRCTNEEAGRKCLGFFMQYGEHLIRALSSRRQAGDDLSKFRELALQWRHNAQGCGRRDAHAAGTWRSCARELMALVEKGAGNG